MTTSIDLGCGKIPRNPFKCDKVIGVDINDRDGVVRCRVGFEKLPFEDSSIDYVTAYDFIEHLPRFVMIDNEIINPFINTMNEIYRVLTKNGTFYAQTPAYPHPQAFQDPTHVNIITDETIKYFTGEIKDLEGNPIGPMYGFTGLFEAEQSWLEYNLIWKLNPIK